MVYSEFSRSFISWFPWIWNPSLQDFSWISFFCVLGSRGWMRIGTGREECDWVLQEVAWSAVMQSVVCSGSFGRSFSRKVSMLSIALIFSFRFP